MFQKEGSGQGQGTNSNNSKSTKSIDVPLRKSDRRHLRKRVGEYFQEEDEETLKDLLDAAFLQGTLSARNIPLDRKTCKMVLYLRSPEAPPSQSSKTTTTQASADSSCWPFHTNSQFVWMSLEEKNKEMDATPTVALWAAMAPLLESHRIDHYTVSVPPQVSKFVCRGADLMRAGMRSLPTSVGPGTNKSNMVAIRVQGNPQPFAVGKVKDNTHTMQDLGVGTKGIGVEIWNTYGDDMWRQQHSADHEHRAPTTTTTNHTSPIGGASFDNGHYGNVGFLDGKVVYALQGQEHESDSESEDDDEEDDEAQEDSTPQTAWDEPGDVPTGGQPTGDDDSNLALNAANELSAAAKVMTIEDSTSPTGDVTKHQEPTMAPATTATSTKDEEEEPESSASPEEILHQAVCQALVAVAKKDLPMSVSIFYAQYVLPNRPQGSTIQLKQTKYKKFGTYLAEQVRDGLLTVGPDASKKDPMAFLTGVNRRHIDLRGFKSSEAVGSKSAADTSKKLVIVTLYMIPSHWPNLLRLDSDQVQALHANSEARKGSGMLTGSEARKMLEDYVDREELVSPSRRDTVNLDGPLTDVLYKKMNSAAPESLLRKDLAKLWAAKMSSAYALVEMPGSKILELKRGHPPKVEIEVQMRQSRKFVTRVRGLEDYAIDPVNFASDVARRFACAGAVDTDPMAAGRAALRKGRVEVIFQGNLVEELEALLQDETLTSHGGAKGSDYCIPKNVIDITLRKGVPGRKKVG
jgi:translation initiation factor 2D